MEDRDEQRARLDELRQVPSSALVTHISELEELLSADDPVVRSHALALVVELSADAPERATALIEPVAEQLGVDEHQQAAAQALADLVPERPEAIEPQLPLLVTALDAGGAVSANVTYVLSVLSDVAPDALTQPGVRNRLFALLASENVAVRMNVTRVLGDVARTEPEALLDDVDALQSCLGDHSPAVRQNAAFALGELASESPTVVFDAVDTLCALAEHEDREVRTAAVYALCTSAANAGAVDDTAVDAVVSLLDCLASESIPARRHAGFLLATVAAKTETVDRHADRLRRHAGDSDHRVRENLERALAELDTGSSVAS